MPEMSIPCSSRGNVRKWRGKLVGQDLKKIREKAHQSRDYLFACLGYKLDILA